MQTKSKTKFYAGDFLDEEQFLGAKHAEGQAFQSMKFGGGITYRSTAPAKYTYRLDFPSAGMTRQAWLDALSSLGWKSCGKLHTWECLCKPDACDCAAEEGQNLFHSEYERARHGRSRADREALFGVLPMAVFYFSGLALRGTGLESTLWGLAALFLIVAIAVVLPAFKVRSKLGAIMLDCQKRGKEPAVVPDSSHTTP